MVAWDKHSSLFGLLVRQRKKFSNIDNFSQSNKMFLFVSDEEAK